jgi:glucokinase
MLLIGDIGGTNARLALAEPGTTEPIEERYFPCAVYSAFEPILAEYLAAMGTRISAGCLAVAGPVSNDGRKAKLTNLPWTLDADLLASDFETGPLTLVNDFAGAALGVTVAPAESVVPLQHGTPLSNAPRLVVGAGTGLGMAILMPQGTAWRVLPSEGGHVGFSPLDDDQERVWRALLAEHGRVTAERVISGPGLTAIHRILAGEELDAAEISRRAIIDGENVASRSVSVFLAAYGAFAGDMAMATMARGGIFLAGGIAAKLLPLMAESPFLKAFNAKAEHAELVRHMPVSVVTDPSLGLRGAAYFANCSASP